MISVLVAALAAAACESSPAERICQRSAGAQVCLVESGKAYDVTASGLLPRSELVVAADGNAERPLVLPVDHDGRAPSAGGGTAGILPGPARQTFTVTGESATGADIRLEFEVPAASR